VAKRIVILGKRIIVEEKVYRLEWGFLEILFGRRFKWVFFAGPFKTLEDAKKALENK